MKSVKVITVAESRALEQAADQGGLSFAQMMENAGRATARAVEQLLPLRERRVLVLVGPGNNGGDGLVAAHYMAQMGARVTCYLWKRKAEADAHLDRVQAGGLPVIWAEDDDGQALQGLLLAADLVVDALLGVGVSLPLREDLRSLLAAVRSELRRPREPGELAHAVPGLRARPAPLVVAVDCPTGLDSDTGEVDPATLRADLTVTFAHPKVGLLRFPGAGFVGRIVVADIGIPPSLAGEVTLEMATAETIGDWLPDRPHSAHKGTFGRLLVVAGSLNYVGAAALAGSGAKRVGAGLVTMALPAPIQSAVAANLAEATYLLLPHDMGVVNSGAVEVVRERMGGYDALLLGPGLSQEDETVAFVHSFLGLPRQERRGRLGFVDRSEAEGQEQPAPPPLVIDADGLNALSRAEGWWRLLPPGTILTPHPGEMARLLGGGTTTAEVQADREGIARRMAREWNAVVVLKGALTVVAAPEGRAVIEPFANSGLATAGTGDVLAGAIAGLRAQGLGAFEAAVTGAYVHGLAGELARADLGEMGMVAGDLPPRLPLALRRIRT